MIKPRVIRIITPGPPGPAGDGITMTGPAVLGRATGTGPAVSLPLGPGLSIVDGALVSSGGTTNLSYDPVTQTLASSSGDDAILPEATTTTAGLMSAAGQTRLEQLGADDAPSFAGLTITGFDPVLIPHIHGALAGVVCEHVRNVSGATMAALTPYHVVNSQGDTDRVQIIPADASDPASMPASGILMTALANNEDGHGVIAGVPTGLNTAANPSGTTLYVGSGVLTPTPPAANVQALAIVGRSHATTGTLAMLSGPALARAAYSGDYNHLANKPTLGSAAAQDVNAFATAAQGSKADTAVQPGTLATVLGDYVLGTDFRLSNDREWSAATVEQAEAEAGTATTRRAWTAQRVRQAIAAWWTGASTDAGRALVTAVDAAAQRTALALSSADLPQFTGVGLGIPSRAGYAAAVGSGVFSRAQIVTAVGSTYSCDIRAGTRFILSDAIAGNTTIQFTNVADLTTGAGFAEYVELRVDFRYTSGIVTVSAAGFTTVWDGNAALVPTAGEIETLVVSITPAVAGTPLNTATLYVTPMKGRE